MANARSDARHLNAIRRAVATRFLPALGYRDYRILWFASLLGGAAASGLIVARGWMVFTLSDSGWFSNTGNPNNPIELVGNYEKVGTTTIQIPGWE